MSEKSFKDWYRENKGDLAAKRRERYHSDPAHREAVLARARDYRRRVGETPRILEGDPVKRGKRYGWRRSSVAYKMGVSLSTLKRILAQAPKPTLPGRPSAWTDNQIDLMKAVAQANTKFHRETAIENMKANWKK